MAELMAVVAIVGILAMIATVSVRKYVASSKTTEAVQMIGSIKGAQETYKDETFKYLNVSTDLSGSGSFFPANPKPGQQKMNFAGSGVMADAWHQLGVLSDAPVLFVYACTAGSAATPVTGLVDMTVANWPTNLGKPWYAVEARADLNGDGTTPKTVFVSGSFAGEIFSTIE